MVAAKKTATKVAAPSAAPAASVAAPAADTAPKGDGADLARDEEIDQAEAIKPGEGEVFVLARKGLERFHRCGMRFGREPTVLVVAELEEGVLERLKAEPNLQVVEGSGA